MPFDLFIGLRRDGPPSGWTYEQHAWIDHDEEAFLELVHGEPLVCPVFARIHMGFYDSPRLSAEDCARALKELELLAQYVEGRPEGEAVPQGWETVRPRLQDFLEAAVCLGRAVETVSD